MVAAQSIESDTIRSVSGATWKLRSVNERDVLAITQRYGLSEVVARILVAREVTIDDVEAFLEPTLRHFLKDPMHFMDMGKAIERVSQAIIQQQQIAVFGDYDVDGATSSALIIRFLRMLGYQKDVLTYIPDRIEEGYGPNPKAMRYLRNQGVDVCITVDCGAAAFEALEVADEVGLDVVVLDHHLGAETLPKAYAVVNPNRLDEITTERHLAAVGVTFCFLVALRKQLVEMNVPGIKGVDLLSLLDLVALGTVCDVVPLKSINRAFVLQGLKVMRRRRNVGINAIIDTAGVDDIPNAYQLGFVIGPRVNAGGRVGESGLGTTILSSDSAEVVYPLAQKLDLYNRERKSIETQVLDEASEQLDRAQESPLVFVQSEGWHPGVIGIVASRLKDMAKKPVAVISIEDGIGKASARSVPGVDFGAAVVAAKQEGLLIAGGGHAMAAGFSVELEKIDALHAFLNARMEPYYDESRVKEVSFDGYLSVGGISSELCESLEQLEPFGVGNSEPRFVISNARVIKVSLMGESHLNCILSDKDTGGYQSRVRAVAFRCVGTELGDKLLSSEGSVVSLLGKVRLNRWQGRNTAELYIDDVAV